MPYRVPERLPQQPDHEAICKDIAAAVGVPSDHLNERYDERGTRFFRLQEIVQALLDTQPWRLQ